MMSVTADQRARVGLSARLGFAIIFSPAIILTGSRFLPDIEEFPPLAMFFLFAIPTVALGYLLFQLSDRALSNLRDVDPPAYLAVVGLALLGGVLLVATNSGVGSRGFALLTFISGAATSFVFLLPTFQAMNAVVREGQLLALTLVGILSSMFSSYLAGYLVAVQDEPTMLIAAAVLLNLTIAGMFLALVLDWKKRIAQAEVGIGYEIFIFSLLLVFTAATSTMTRHFLETVEPGGILRYRSLGLLSVTCSVFTLPWAAWLHYSPARQKLWPGVFESRFVAFLREYRTGLIASVLFFITYLALSGPLNLEIFHRDDMFFDTDAASWREKFATFKWQDAFWRPVHPFVLLIVRPVVMLLGHLMGGDTLAAVSIVVAMAAAASVFLVWVIMRRLTGNGPYALLAASVFGISATQLIFGALAETYIFSTLLLIIFLLVVQDESTPMPVLATLSILTAGVTISNLAQNLIALYVLRPNLRLVTRFAIFVGSCIVVLGFINNMVYPGANTLFFVPHNLGPETTNLHPITALRPIVVGREMLIYSEIAPEPLVASSVARYPRFWFYSESFNKREGLQVYLSEFETFTQELGAYLWAALILGACVSFAVALYRKAARVRLLIALALIVLFNLLFHLLYGNDLFLYSPHMLYALVLFVFLALADMTKHKWYLAGLGVFLIIAAINNFAFIYLLNHTLLTSVIQG